MDSASITQIATTVTEKTSLIPNMDTIGWVLLFCGWLLYWLKELNACRIGNKNGPFLTKFWQSNMFEVPTSLISCFVLAILGNSIPPDLLDMSGRISTLLIGYSSSSILNSLITMGKKG